jgi:hypothetical protein
MCQEDKLWTRSRHAQSAKAKKRGFPNDAWGRKQNSERAISHPLLFQKCVLLTKSCKESRVTLISSKGKVLNAEARRSQRRN